jgi:hypothetical protein
MVSMGTYNGKSAVFLRISDKVENGYIFLLIKKQRYFVLLCSSERTGCPRAGVLGHGRVSAVHRAPSGAFPANGENINTNTLNFKDGFRSAQRDIEVGLFYVPGMDDIENASCRPPPQWRA